MQRGLSAVFLALVVACATGCGDPGTREAVPGGDAARGAALITAYGCGACHTIAGVDGADGQVGPSLARLAKRRTIAGRLPNTPADLVHWIREPQTIDPGNVMPDLGLDSRDARDIAAYLYRH